jgi:hypothetical protein
MKTFSVLCLLLISGSSVLLASSAVSLKPGKYEVTGIREMNGKQYPGHSIRCISAADLEDPEAVFNERVFARYKPDPSCTQHNLTNSGGKLSYDEHCANRTVHVDATLSGTEYSAVRSVTPKASGALGFTFKMTGKRIGDCTK